MGVKTDVHRRRISRDYAGHRGGSGEDMKMWGNREDDEVIWEEESSQNCSSKSTCLWVPTLRILKNRAFSLKHINHVPKATNNIICFEQLEPPTSGLHRLFIKRRWHVLLADPGRWNAWWRHWEAKSWCSNRHSETIYVGYYIIYIYTYTTCGVLWYIWHTNTCNASNSLTSFAKGWYSPVKSMLLVVHPHFKSNHRHDPILIVAEPKHGPAPPRTKRNPQTSNNHD